MKSPFQEFRHQPAYSQGFDIRPQFVQLRREKDQLVTKNPTHNRPLPTSAVFLKRAILDVKDLPPLSSAILLSSQGVASLPDALTPFSSDSLTAWLTCLWISSPTASCSCGIGTAIRAPFCIPNCCCVSKGSVEHLRRAIVSGLLQRILAAVSGSYVFHGTCNCLQFDG